MHIGIANDMNEETDTGCPRKSNQSWQMDFKQ